VIEENVFLSIRTSSEKKPGSTIPHPLSGFPPSIFLFAIVESPINEPRAKGGIPVLFNSIVRRNFVQPKDASIAEDIRRIPGASKEQPKEGTVLFDTHGAYLDSPRNVAKELGVTFIDLNKITHD